MVLEFLKTYESELLSEKEMVDRSLEEICTKEQETRKFLKLIESENEEVFSEFTPRNITSKGDAKIAEIKQTLEDVLGEKEVLQNHCNALNQRLEDVKAAIAETEIQAEPQPAEPKEEHSATSLSDPGVLRNKLQQVLSYLPADPLRAKIELEELLSSDL